MSIAEPRLRIVPLADVIPHEECDPRAVERLVERLQADKILKNPPIVSESEGRYVVLDGATRVSALRALEYRDILVQIVDYEAPQIGLYTWHHVIVGFPEETLLQGIRRLSQVEVVKMDTEAAEKALLRRELLCYLVLRTQEVYALRAEADFIAQVILMNSVVNLYRGQADVYRAVTTDLDHLLLEYPNFTALVVFPRYMPAEIMRLSLNRARLPMGLTRHVIPGRALRLNVGLEILSSSIPLEEKNAWLDNLIRDKFRERRVRFYQEPVFIFDE